MPSMDNVVVTGATGFLGGAVARRLVRDGATVVGSGRDGEAGRALEDDGVRFVPAPLDDARAVSRLIEGTAVEGTAVEGTAVEGTAVEGTAVEGTAVEGTVVEGAAVVVVHCGALASPWGRDRDFHQANVVGTQNVVDACLRHGVRRLVHVSTPSVYTDGTDRRGVRESAALPPPTNPYARSPYARTKRAAEAIVDAATADGLAAVTLRPRAIFGPGDRTILPRIISALEKGRLPVIGDGATVVDLTYIDDAVDAVLAAIAVPDVTVSPPLDPPRGTVPDVTVGRKYNITSGEPVELWPTVRDLARRLDLPPPRGRLPFAAAQIVAAGLENVYKMLPGRPEPRLTRYSVVLLARTLTLSIEAARRDLGYNPRVGVREGLDRFIAWWKTT